MRGIKFRLLTILILIVFSCIVVYSNQIDAQEVVEDSYLHEETLYEIDRLSLGQHPNIPSGDHPIGLGVYPKENTLYVANYADDTISVINGTNNTKMGEDIDVGRAPFAIGVDD